MTVITKPLSGNKAKNKKEPLFAEAAGDGGAKLDVETGVEPRFVILGSRAHRVSTATTVCLFLTALLVMSIGIIGGMYLYRQFARSQMRFHGWCTIPYNIHPQSLHQEAMSLEDDFEKVVRFQPENEALDMTKSFKQEFDIDLQDEDVEKILVPDFGGGRKGKFIHDFKTNKTGIIDLNGDRCFIMPLNRQRVFPPLSMMDLIFKMAQGYYEVDTEVVRDTMRVVVPPVTDFTTIGNYIAQECRNRKTYFLEKDKGNGISKRSASDSHAVFTEFAGSKISELSIDTTALNEFERKEAQI